MWLIMRLPLFLALALNLVLMLLYIPAAPGAEADAAADLHTCAANDTAAAVNETVANASDAVAVIAEEIVEAALVWEPPQVLIAHFITILAAVHLCASIVKLSYQILSTAAVEADIGLCDSKIALIQCSANMAPLLAPVYASMAVFTGMLTNMSAWLDVLMQVPTLTAVAYLLTSVLANTVSYYFFALHLFDLMGLPAVQMLLQSVTHNGTKLLQTAMVIMLVVYFYAVLGYTLFYEQHAEGKCDTLLRCFVSYLTGGISGDGTPPPCHTQLVELTFVQVSTTHLRSLRHPHHCLAESLLGCSHL